MKFTKMHGAGNDYVLLDARGTEHDWAKLARQLCDRHYGVGSDGLLLVNSSTVADICMRMFNPDGSESEMCGNGIRCFAKYVVDRHIVPRSEGPLRVDTGAGVVDIVPSFDGHGRVIGAQVNMGEPRFHAEEIPAHALAGETGLQLDIKSDSLDINIDITKVVVGYPIEVDGRMFKITCVSMGNPHAVAFLDEPVSQFPLRLLGPLMEHHDMFPRRVNFHVVNVLDRNRLRARTWERGAGLTLACGTGACAIQAAARLLGLTDDQVEVEMPGGVLAVTWPGHGQVYMEGPVEEVFVGKWSNEGPN